MRLAAGLVSAFFGLGVQYDSGVDPYAALNGNDVAVEVHKSEVRDRLFYRVGAMREGAVGWGPGSDYDNGIMPTVAVNDNRVVVELHRTQAFGSFGLFYRVGTVDPGARTIRFGDSRQFDNGSRPSVALNNGGVVVEVHETSNRVKNEVLVHVGRVQGGEIKWGPVDDYDNGATPRVAINDSGLVVEVHKSHDSDVLLYHVGRISGDRINWGPRVKYQDGVQPSIALLPDGSVIEAHKSEGLKNDLYQMTGKVQGDQIVWSGGAVRFDEGRVPSVASNGRKALQVHQSQALPTLWSSNSLLMDRGNWMGDRLDALKDRALRQVAMPASHDSGMFAGNILGRTQDEDSYQQLGSGIRYFDFRVGRNMKIAHGIVDGPPVQEVLDGFRRFMAEGHRELAILKFSHYGDGFNDNDYRTLAAKIQATIGPWLYATPAWTGRLADAPLGQLLGGGGKLLVVSDGNFALTNKVPGIYVYRDWDSEDPRSGDLTVFDKFADTTFYDTMRNDQLGKFAAFNGKCAKDPGVPCDLFLLSWTLTPPTGVFEFAKIADRNLGDVMAGLRPNAGGFVPNLLYVDYAELARPADIAVEFNARR